MLSRYGTYAVCTVLSAAFLVSWASEAAAGDVMIKISESVGLDINIDASPKTGDAPVSVKVTGMIGGGTRPYTYVLKFGDGTVKRGRSYTGKIVTRHEYTRIGDYTISLSARDSRGRVGTSSGEAVRPSGKGKRVSRIDEVDPALRSFEREVEREGMKQTGTEFVEPSEYDEIAEEVYETSADPFEHEKETYKTIVEPRSISGEDAYETLIGPSIEELEKLAEHVEEETEVPVVIPAPEVVPPPWEKSSGYVTKMYTEWHPQQTKAVFVADRAYSEVERDIESGWEIGPRKYRLRPMLVAEEGSWGTRGPILPPRPILGAPRQIVRSVPVAAEAGWTSGTPEPEGGDWAVSPGWKNLRFGPEFVFVGDEILWKEEGGWEEYESYLYNMPDEKTQPESDSDPALPVDYGSYEKDLRIARKETADRLTALAPTVESTKWSKMSRLKLEHETPRRIIVATDWKGVIGRPYWCMIYRVTNFGKKTADLNLGVSLETNKGVYHELYSPEALAMIRKKERRTFLNLDEIPEKLEPGETVEAVAIFGGVSDASTVYNFTVSGLDSAYRIDGEDFGMFHKLLVISYERPGDEFQIDFDRFEYKDTFWIEKNFKEG